MLRGRSPALCHGNDDDVSIGLKLSLVRLRCRFICDYAKTAERDALKSIWAATLIAPVRTPLFMTVGSSVLAESQCASRLILHLPTCRKCIAWVWQSARLVRLFNSGRV